MVDTFVVREEEGRMVFSEALSVSPEAMKQMHNPIRIEMLKLLSKKPMYPAEIAIKLKIHEQKIYYHVNQMLKAGILEVVERKEIRGTTAKLVAPKSLNFTVSMSKDWKPFDSFLDTESNQKMKDFLSPFTATGLLSGSFVVGSPDPHGPLKASARDGHYAIDLAMYLGRFCRLSDDFSVRLDVDIKNEKKEAENLIIVGGPVTNIMMSDINPLLPVRFTEDNQWELSSEKTGKVYTDDKVGLIARIPNPNDESKMILLIAGIRYVGTKAAVIALTRFSELVLQKFNGQKKWAAVVQGFDLDGDGKIDSVELLE